MRFGKTMSYSQVGGDTLGWKSTEQMDLYGQFDRVTRETDKVGEPLMNKGHGPSYMSHTLKEMWSFHMAKRKDRFYDIWKKAVNTQFKASIQVVSDLEELSLMRQKRKILEITKAVDAEMRMLGIRKRPRVLPANARQILSDMYSVYPKPSAAQREFLAKKCKLSTQQVRVWFANKRARSKKQKQQ